MLKVDTVKPTAYSEVSLSSTSMVLQLDRTRIATDEGEFEKQEGRREGPVGRLKHGRAA